VAKSMFAGKKYFCQEVFSVERNRFLPPFGKN